MFNPFGLETMIELEQALRTATKSRAECRIIYYNPKHLEAFRYDGFWDIEYVANLGGAPGPMYQPVAYIRRSDASS